MHTMGVGRSRSLLVLPALFVLIVLAAYLRIPYTQTARFIPSERIVSNPLMGVAPDARTDPARADEGTRLVWAEVTWRELEPEEGEYAFDAFDEAIHIDQWRQRGAKLILRLSLDSGRDGIACDIPLWLKEKVRGTEYIAGGEERFAPDYADTELQDRHLKLLHQIEKRYGGDIAYVEMGSLGSGGSWKSLPGAPKLPMTDVTGVYIWQYFTAFSGHTVLAAGPYHEALLLESGAYMDDISQSEEAWGWINRYRFGGWDDQIDTFLRAYSQYGLTSPSGAWLRGEIADAQAAARLVRECRAVYLCCTDGNVPDALRKEIGYRFWLRQASWPQRVRPDYSLYVDIVVENDGSAPAPVDMPLSLALIDERGNVLCTERTDACAGQWAPGTSEERVRITVPHDMEKGEYLLAAAVCDPETLEPAVRFAMECDTFGLWHVLGSVRVY